MSAPKKFSDLAQPILDDPERAARVEAEKDIALAEIEARVSEADLLRDVFYPGLSLAAPLRVAATLLAVPSSVLAIALHPHQTFDANGRMQCDPSAKWVCPHSPTDRMLELADAAAAWRRENP